MRRTDAVVALLIGVLTPSAALGKARAPEWLAAATAASVPSYDPKTPAVVLCSEEALTLDRGGRVEGVARYAVRILHYEGRPCAVARWDYETDGSGVRDLKAWMIDPGGDVTEYGSGKVLDVAAARNDVYGEARARVLDASDEANVGSVFGFEVRYTRRTFSGQFLWNFQGELPVLRSRFSLSVPPGWSAKGTVFNHEPVTPAVNGTTYIWEVASLPWIADEPARPPVTSLAPWVAVDAVPAPDDRNASMTTYGSWTDVARWLDGISAPSAVTDPALEAKARGLASGPSVHDRIDAIGRYVQSLAYIAIQIDVSRGGGYRPHPAAQVFAKSYGDCKDKANLMKTMLRCVGVESYLTAIRASDRTFVRPEWPSPYPFNHCILAIRADAESSAATVTDPTFGRLLFFDPTNTDTPIGDLPEEEQGAPALLIAPQGGLVRTPVTPAERNAQVRRIDAELDATGAIHGTVRELSRGSEAAAERAYFRSVSPQDYRTRLQAWIARSASNASVTTIAPHDDPAADRFELAVDFQASGYASSMGKDRLLFRPALVSRHERLTFTEPTRKYPVQLDGWTCQETTRTKLPNGYRVEELPQPVRLERPFGTYAARAEAKEDVLVLERTLELHTTTVPPDQYDSLRTFFESIRAADLAVAVLSRSEDR